MYENGAYLAANPDWHEGNSEWKASKIVDLLRRNHVVPGSLCEVGCGAGAILASLQRTWPECTLSGFEMSPQAFEICRKKANDRLTFHHDDVTKHSAAHFDVLMLIDVFEHVEDYMGLLRKVRPMAHYKVFHVPVDLSALGVAREAMMMARERVGHLHYFTKKTALATFDDCGYQVVDHFYTARGLEIAGPDWKTRLMKLPRAIAFRLSPDRAALLLGGF
ncbi:MAG: class I SAM-dependent methyltransferase [Polyangiaceae bacterium]